MQNPKVLVAIPYHKTKRYCLDALLQAVDDLTYDNKDVVMRFDTGEYGGDDNVKKQREFFRKLALTENFDYLFFMGADTIPPSDVIERLLKYQRAIVGGVYWGRHEAHNGRPEGAVAWIHADTQESQSKAFNTLGWLISVDGMGMDCVLIHRSVLEKISWMDWKQNDDDYPFYDRAKELGHDIFIDTAIQCRHYYSENGYTYRGEVCEQKPKVV